jgi:hypothetical protein
VRYRAGDGNAAQIDLRGKAAVEAYLLLAAEPATV